MHDTAVLALRYKDSAWRNPHTAYRWHMFLRCLAFVFWALAFHAMGMEQGTAEAGTAWTFDVLGPILPLFFGASVVLHISEDRLLTALLVVMTAPLAAMSALSGHLVGAMTLPVYLAFVGIYTLFTALSAVVRIGRDSDARKGSEVQP